MTLKHRTFSAVRWTTTAAAAWALLQLAQVAVLARLLAPEDYGLMAMVAVVLGFATVFTDLYPAPPDLKPPISPGEIMEGGGGRERRATRRGPALDGQEALSIDRQHHPG